MDQRGFRPTGGESIFRTGSISSKSSRKTARRNSTTPVSQTAEGSTPHLSKTVSMRELTTPASRLQGSQVTANLPKAPADADSQAYLCTLKSQRPSRE
ncbi:hypothetical protein MTO96_040818 [Rhipicephalus appendiculatus]